MKPWEKWAIGGAIGALVVAIGVELYEKGKTATVSGPIYNGGGVIPYVLSSGTMTQVALSLTGDNQLQLSPPTSGAITGATSSATAVLSAGVSSASSVTFTAASIGTATATVSWTDSSGKAQTSTIPVNVSA